MQPRVKQWLFEQPPPQHLEPLDLSNPPKKCKLDLSYSSTKHKFDTMADDNDNDDDQQVQLQLPHPWAPSMTHTSIGFHDKDRYCVVSISIKYI